MCFDFLLGIGGLGDMKLIYGTTVARKKAKAEKEDKVRMILCEHLDSPDDFAEAPKYSFCQNYGVTMIPLNSL